MLTRYNFGAARDPEMLHKIYNAEPVALIMEILRRDLCQSDVPFPNIIPYVLLYLNLVCVELAYFKN